MKSAIVYPNFSLDIFRKGGHESTWINHGIASIISYANMQGLKIDLIDGRRISSFEEFENLVKEYDLVGYSVTTLDYRNTVKAIEVNKNVNNDAVIVVGGVDPSIDSEKYVDNPLIDSVIVGEGEIAFANLIKSVENNENIDGLIIGDKIEDLDSLEFIDRSLWESESVIADFDLQEPFFTLISSRACIYNCRFCQPVTKRIFGEKERSRSPENFVDEIKLLQDNYGLKSFYILDDNALQNRKWLEGFIENYEKNQIKADFMMSARCDNIYKNRDLIPKLKSLGLNYVNVGFESGSDKILKYIKKGSTVDLNYKAAKILNDNDIKILAFMLFGFPNETKEDIYAGYEFIKNINPELIDSTTYSPFPGTDLYKEYKEKNYLYDDSIYAVCAPHSIKLRGVKYFYINWIIFRMGFFVSKTYTQKLKKLIYFVLAGLNMLFQRIKIFFTYR